jgi:hemolysin III
VRPLKYYSEIEERINVFSHVLGLVLGVIAVVLMISKTVHSADSLQLISAVIYGLSIIALYLASSLYHNTQEKMLRRRLKILDHAAIYLLIAGTYTPYAMVTLNGKIGWGLFVVSWGLALLGILLKLFFTGRFTLISTLAYVLMGWLVVFVYTPLSNSLSTEGIFWLLAGGAAYTFGALLYVIHRLKFNHALFHVFVVIGSVCHFISIYFYVYGD